MQQLVIQSTQLVFIGRTTTHSFVTTSPRGCELILVGNQLAIVEEAAPLFLSADIACNLEDCSNGNALSFCGRALVERKRSNAVFACAPVTRDGPVVVDGGANIIAVSFGKDEKVYMRSPEKSGLVVVTFDQLPKVTDASMWLVDGLGMLRHTSGGYTLSQASLQDAIQRKEDLETMWPHTKQQQVGLPSPPLPHGCNTHDKPAEPLCARRKPRPT